MGTGHKGLALVGVEAVEPANRFIAEHCLPRHNARFAVTLAEPGSAFVPDAGRAARDILYIQHERQFGNDNTVRYNGFSLQISTSPIRTHYVRATVRVYDHPDGTLAVFHGPRCIARHDADASQIEATRQRAA